MNSTQIILCLCILFLCSAVAKTDFGRRDKRNMDIREYLERVVKGMDGFEQQLLQQQNTQQLLTERYAELVVKDQDLLEQNANLARQNAELAIQTANQNKALHQRDTELTNQMTELANQTEQLFRLNDQLVVKNQELLDQNGKLARQKEDLAILTANQNAALQQRDTELTNQIEQLTNQTQELFRLNALLVAEVAGLREFGDVVANREDVLVVQNLELTARLAQFGVDLNQSRELQNTISRTIVTQSAQIHNFSLQNEQFQNSLRENIAEMRQNSKNQSTMLGRRLEQISTDSQQKLFRTEEFLSKKLNSTELLLREYTTNQVNQLTKQISSSAHVAKQELTNHTRNINEKLRILEAKSERGHPVTFYEGRNYWSYTEEFVFDNSSCLASPCCRNLDYLNGYSKSLRTRNVCVKVFLYKDCFGYLATFDKYSSIPDLRDNSNKISSVIPCHFY